MDRILAREQAAALTRMAGGLLLVFGGFALRGMAPGLMQLVVFVVVLVGVVQAAGNFGAFLRIREMAQRGESMEDGGAAGGFTHNRSSRRALSRQVMALLMAMAEADGRAGAKERLVVQQLLLERFFDPEMVGALRAWQPPSMPAGGVEELARSLFGWCCLVSFVDQRFSREEHDALQAVSRGFQLHPTQARTIFLATKQRAMHMFGGAGPRGGGYQGGGGYRSGSGSWDNAGSGRAQPPRNGALSRAEALRILELPPAATPEEIRKRHRELAKKHHPDRNSHLGEIARKQATERFTEIQRAYESLTKA